MVVVLFVLALVNFAFGVVCCFLFVVCVCCLHVRSCEGWNLLSLYWLHGVASPA